MTNMLEFIHDDITWCLEDNCPFINCYRNTVNMMDRTGLHSYAIFKGTRECPLHMNLDDCINGCRHVKECFEKHEDPDEALKELTDKYCDNCIFSSVEED